MVFVCDECGAAWPDRNALARNRTVYPEPPDYIVEPVGVSLLASRGTWATLEEIEHIGLADLVGGEDIPLGG